MVILVIIIHTVLQMVMTGGGRAYNKYGPLVFGDCCFSHTVTLDS